MYSEFPQSAGKEFHECRSFFSELLTALLTGVSCALFLGGCAGYGTVQGEAEEPASEEAEISETDTAVRIARESEEICRTAGEQIGLLSDSSLEIGFLDAEHMFSERDLLQEPEDADAEHILLSDGASSSDSENVEVSGDTVTITAKGVYVLTGELSNGQILVDAGGKKVVLILDGASVANGESPALRIKKAGKVFLNLREGTENRLISTAETEEGEKEVPAISSSADLVLNGNGGLEIGSNSGNGIVSSKSLRMTGGSITIRSGGTAVKAGESIRIGGGNLEIDAQADGLHSESEDPDEGFIYISGGEIRLIAGSDGLDGSGTVQMTDGDLSLSSGDDAFHSDEDLILAGGNVRIEDCYEGFEAERIAVTGGSWDLTSRDDGINSMGGLYDGFFQRRTVAEDTESEDTEDSSDNDECFVLIAGGILHIVSEGDGIDSNGGLYVTGGSTVVDGPSYSMNGALDYTTEGIITGGTLSAAGTRSMAVNFEENSTQGSILAVFSQTIDPGTEIILRDDSGKELYRVTVQKSCDSVVISLPEIEPDRTYIVEAGEQKEEITLVGSTGSSSGAYGHFGMRGHP